MAQNPSSNGSTPFDQPLSICIQPILSIEPETNELTVYNSFNANKNLQLPNLPATGQDEFKTITPIDSTVTASVSAPAAVTSAAIDSTAFDRLITSRMTAYTDFDLFYVELVKAKQAGKIDEATFDKLNKIAE